MWQIIEKILKLLGIKKEEPVPVKVVEPERLETFEKGTVAWYVNAYAQMEIDPGCETRVQTAALTVRRGMARYEVVELATGIPWYFIGAIHHMEASCDFTRCLHNGERIIGTGKKTTLVPAGRGPFATWEKSAIDALKMRNLHLVQHWTLGEMLLQAERYNGLGYLKYHPAENSPYLWACTTINDGNGKYIADNKWSETADANGQVGLAAIINELDLSEDIEVQI